MYRGISIVAIPEKRNNLLMEITEYLMKREVNIWAVSGYWDLNRECENPNGVYRNEEMGALLYNDADLIEARFLSFYENERLCGCIPEVKNYDEFMNSDAVAILFVTDSCYFDLYMKDQHDINDLFQKLQSRCYGDLELITDENDGRYRFT